MKQQSSKRKLVLWLAGLAACAASLSLVLFFTTSARAHPLTGRVQDTALIVSGVVTDSHLLTTAGTERDWSIEVTDVYRGEAPGDPVYIRTAGTFDALREGDSVLVFLYRPRQMGDRYLLCGDEDGIFYLSEDGTTYTDQAQKEYDAKDLLAEIERLSAKYPISEKNNFPVPERALDVEGAPTESTD